ncbi:hypothetical protein GCM10009745_24630 [Kribbella yunnanensis]|uniref:NIPSNAP domain-containing protein n=1 Tax=Kribbella yunnanensis TaxID=190194 RepID=A0ABN2H0K0_9ACTN
MPDDNQVTEIRTYRLHESGRDKFHQVMASQAVPLMTAAGLKVVYFGPCAADPNAYLLIRAFASPADRELEKAAFYGSAAWKDGIEAEVMSCIDTYLTAVVHGPIGVR